ncbi:MAG: hypothetical protein NVS3B15_12250 [Sediminibacterium sp.]
MPDAAVLRLKAPETFKAVFKTTKGDFVVEAYRKWSPLGVDRLYQLLKTGFYNNNLLFRVEPGYVIQFGISDQKAINHFWNRRKLPDEPPLHKHLKGVVAFARGMANSRATQLFINAVDNPMLDTVVRKKVKGYSPVAKVISGMNVVAGLCSIYGRSTLPFQDSVYKYGNRYMDKKFPGLDRIISARIIP